MGFAEQRTAPRPTFRVIAGGLSARGDVTPYIPALDTTIPPPTDRPASVRDWSIGELMR